MKKTILTSVFAMFAASAASAAVTPYAAIRGGYDYHTVNTGSITVDGTDIGAELGNPAGSGYAFGAAAGVSADLSDFFGVRGEVEYTYANANLEEDTLNDDDLPQKDKFESDSHTVLLNVYGDIKTATPFTPYVGAGIGYSWSNIALKEEGGKLEFDDSAFAWQVGAGVSYALDNALTLDLGYRFMNVMGLEYEGTDEGEAIKVKADTYSHQVYLGARYAF